MLMVEGQIQWGIHQHFENCVAQKWSIILKMVSDLLNVNWVDIAQVICQFISDLMVMLFDKQRNHMSMTNNSLIERTHLCLFQGCDSAFDSSVNSIHYGLLCPFYRQEN